MNDFFDNLLIRNYLFFENLYGDDPTDGILVIWTKPKTKLLPKKNPIYVRLNEIDTISEKIEELKRDYNLFFNVLLQESIPANEWERGGTDTTLLMPGLWFDFDVKEGDHEEDELPTREEAIQFIAELDHKPTIVVNSGGGFHGYWLFKKRWKFADDNEREQAKKFSKAFHNHIQDLGSKHGWKFDYTGDLARGLRIPETYNYKKNGCKDVVIEILNEDNMYDKDELIEYYCTEDNNDSSTKTKSSKKKTNKEGTNNPQHDFPPADLNIIEKECSWMRHCKEDAETLSEPEWLGELSIIGRCENGVVKAHEWSMPYPEYDPLDTQNKLIHSMKANPRTCARIISDFGQHCEGCKHRGKITSPITLGTSKYKEEKPDPNKWFELSDIGNAERLIYYHGNDLRYAPHINNWLVWNGDIWKPNTTDVYLMSKEVIRNMRKDLKFSPEAKMIDAHSKKSEKKSNINAMIATAKDEAEWISEEYLDTNIWLLNCPNGTIDLKTGKLRKHRRSDFNTMMIPVTYDPEAECPLFMKFMNDIMEGDQEMIDFLQRVFGYALTGSDEEECLFFFRGEGSNGKTKLLEVIRALMGPYARQANFESFLSKKNDSVRDDIARMQGARYVTAIEVNQGKVLDGALVAKTTGGDKVAARHLYKKYKEFSPTFKFFWAAYNDPVIKEGKHGIWRRIVKVPFNVRFEGEKRDKKIKKKLLKELPGILNWALKGCLEWQRLGGLNPPVKVKRATAKYRDSQDVIGQYLKQRIVESPGERINKSDLYDDYDNWCELNGEISVTQTSFSKSLKNKDYKDGKSNERYWKDIKLVE